MKITAKTEMFFSATFGRGWEALTDVTHNKSPSSNIENFAGKRSDGRVVHAQFRVLPGDQIPDFIVKNLAQ